MDIGSLVIILIACIVCGITTLILAIIYLASSKRKPALIASMFFLISLVAGILCTMEIADQVKDKMSFIKDKFRDQMDSVRKHRNEWKDWDNEKETDAKHNSTLDDTLRSYVPEHVKDTLSKKFWKHDAHGDMYLPLTYPYQLVADESLDKGGRMACFSSNNCRLSAATIVPENITHINLDRNFILFKKNNTLTGRNRQLTEPDVMYVLFDLRTGSTRSFINENQLLQEAIKAGYTGDNELMSLEDYADEL